MCVSRLCRFSCEYTCNSAVIVRTCDCAIAISLLELLPIPLQKETTMVSHTSCPLFSSFIQFLFFFCDFSPSLV